MQPRVKIIPISIAMYTIGAQLQLVADAMQS